MSVHSMTPGPVPVIQNDLWKKLYATWAVAVKEWKITWRYPSQFIAFVMWPIIFPLAYLLSARALSGPDGSGLAVFQSTTGVQDYIGYIGVGTAIWMWQNMVLWNVGFTIRQEQWRGTMESNWITPVWRYAFLIGNSMVSAVTMMMFLLISYLEFTLLLGMQFQGNLLTVLVMIAVAMLPIYGLGMAFASLVLYAKEANTFVFIVRGLVMIFSGITYPISVLPVWMQGVAGWLPPTYVIRGLRAALLQNATVADVWRSDILPLLLFGVFWMVVGYLSFLWMDARARRKGTLGIY